LKIIKIRNYRENVLISGELAMANQDFFLEPDEAQTFGNINYMRKSIKVRHTFPKSLKNPNGFEVTKDISSMSDNSLTDFPEKISPDTSFSSTPSQFSSSNVKSTTNSNSMDLFRNMARNINKR
jgi:hypothetical protein